jgi:4-hydroxybenzoate polyprenyltransferase
MTAFPAQSVPVAIPPKSWRGRLAVFSGDIKIHHTVFAMPWAILSTVLAGRTYPGSFTLGKLGLIVICMAAARTVAMAANRLLDADLDSKNPRTVRRAVPSGMLSRRFVGGMLAGCCMVFIAAAGLFQIFYANPWPLIFAVPVLLYLCGYPFMSLLSGCGIGSRAGLCMAGNNRMDELAADHHVRGRTKLDCRFRYYLRLSGL